MSQIYDSHYDLLTYILMRQKHPKFFMDLSREIYREDNIIGGLINVYYPNPDELFGTLGIPYLDPIYDLQIASSWIEKYGLLPNKDNFRYAIEGCSCLEVEQLKELHDLGVRSIIPVYNEDNQYGGGALGDPNRGLTEEGIRLINEAIKLNIAIDISHLNHKTANNVLDYLITLKKAAISPTVLASHSNCCNITTRARNIPDNIILKIGQLDGIVGIMPRTTFCSSTKVDDYDKAFASHVRHVADLIGIDHVCVASDDMEYHPDKSYQEVAMYNIRNFASSVDQALINNGFNQEERQKVMVKNFENKVLNKINK